MDRTNDSEVQATARETVQDREARLAQRRQRDRARREQARSQETLGWLSKDNEIEPRESKKQLNRGRLGWRVRENTLELLGHIRDKSLDMHKWMPTQAH